jgi:hypothetical protein
MAATTRYEGQLYISAHATIFRNPLPNAGKVCYAALLLNDPYFICMSFGRWLTALLFFSSMEIRMRIVHLRVILYHNHIIIV